MKVIVPKLTIAIDGHSSCGKSTVAKDLAKILSIAYIDTGAMYRAVTLYALQKNLMQKGVIQLNELIRHLPSIQISFKWNAEEKSNETFLNQISVEQEIRNLEVSRHVSAISAVGEVRLAMVKQQQALGKTHSIVMDGRDIGTVVFPNAQLKLFMTASPEIRAQRRFDELQQKGETVAYESILHNVVQRDHLDSTRAESPLKQAPDALVLDNSHMSVAQQLEWVLRLLATRQLISD